MIYFLAKLCIFYSIFSPFFTTFLVSVYFWVKLKWSVFWSAFFRKCSFLPQNLSVDHFYDEFSVFIHSSLFFLFFSFFGSSYFICESICKIYVSSVWWGSILPIHTTESSVEVSIKQIWLLGRNILPGRFARCV